MQRQTKADPKTKFSDFYLYVLNMWLFHMVLKEDQAHRDFVCTGTWEVVSK